MVDSEPAWLRRMRLSARARTKAICDSDSGQIVPQSAPGQGTPAPKSSSAPFCRKKKRRGDGKGTATRYISQTRSICIIRRSLSWLTLSGDVAEFSFAMAPVTLARHSKLKLCDLRSLISDQHLFHGQSVLAVCSYVSAIIVN